MTSPAPPPPDRFRGEHDDQMDQLTAALVLLLGADLAAALDVLAARMAALWLDLFGDLDASPDDDELVAEFRARAALQLDQLPVDQLPVDELLAALLGAVLLGVAQGAAVAGVAQPLGAVVLSAAVFDTVRDVAARAAAAIGQARTLLAAGPLDSFGDAVTVVGAARQSLNTVERTARWATTRAVADGVALVADEHDLPRLWLPERDACLRCLKYAGRIALPGVDFPGGLTYGDKRAWLSNDPVPGPPLHPNCRCRLMPWRGVSAYADERSPNGQLPVGADYPSALRREAERAVVDGWSVGESLAARLRAADRLLKQRPALPKTRIRRGHASILAGRFPPKPF